MTDQDILYIDGKDSHENEPRAMCVHPCKLGLVNKLEKKSFDKVIIKNSKTDYLTAIGLFNVQLVLKDHGICEIYVAQEIVAGQNFESDQIKAVAERAGFKNVKLSQFEEWIQVKGKDVKNESIKLTMVKP